MVTACPLALLREWASRNTQTCTSMAFKKSIMANGFASVTGNAYLYCVDLSMRGSLGFDAPDDFLWHW